MISIVAIYGGVGRGQLHVLDGDVFRHKKIPRVGETPLGIGIGYGWCKSQWNVMWLAVGNVAGVCITTEEIYALVKICFTTGD